jgi:1-acyl-sn-glycerol-3-phosphate acyltransferase
MDRFPLIYRVARGLFATLVFSRRGGIRVQGLERVPTEGGMILASVHLSELDPPALAVALRKRRLRAMAKEELWDNRLFGAIIKGIGAFPVKRGAGDTESIRTCIAILQAGEAVIVFPEGHRNDGVSLNPMLSGVAMLSKKAGVPVVPAGISGTRKGDKGPVTVIFGEPFRYEDSFSEGRATSEKAARQIFLEELEQRILELCAKAGNPLKSAKSTTRRPEYSAPVPSIETKAIDLT